MCGICGILEFSGKPVDRSMIQRMSTSLSHRGPDDEGLITRGNLGIGHRRLSIIDLAMGKQPMFNEDGEVCVTFNGEIYNYRELRDQLKSQGHVFRTQSDTEVIVHAWEQWGKSCVERFRGMFAFAIVDWKRKILFLARDHFGIKPLYYRLNQKQLAFASEIQTFRNLEDPPQQIDLQALDQYLFLQYIPAPRTIFKGVSKLPPAHRLTVHFSGQTEGPERYWSLKFQPSEGKPLEEWVDGLAWTLRDSVKTHLVSDVPFGAFLSGGLDSSTVVSFMAQELGSPVKTFSIGFDETEYSELAHAQQVSERWKTEHHTQIVRPDALAILPTLIEHFGEPFGDSSAIPTYYVAQLARRFVPMVLSGDGGDEALGGYGSYQAWLRWIFPPQRHRPLWKRLLRPWVQRIFPSRYPPDNFPRPRHLDKWYSFIQYMGPEVRKKLWRSSYHSLLELSVEPFETAFRESSDLQPLSQAQYLDYQTYLPNDILTKVDITSMTHGLEARTPLIDTKVVEYIATIPPNLLLKKTNGSWSSKHLLRQILLKYFPSEFMDRPKKGFEVPVAKWFSPGGALRGELEHRLTRKDALLHNFFEPEAIRSMIELHDGAKNNLAGPLWLLFYLEFWLGYFNGTPN